MTGPAQNAINDLLTDNACIFAINHGNTVLVNRSTDGGEASGITIDLAQEIAASLGRTAKFVHYNRAVEVSDAAGQGIWDVCFLAIDPKREEVIAFTDPYIKIAGSYLVPVDSRAQSIADVDQPDVDVVCVRGSAYSLYLKRNAKSANIVEVESFAAAVAAVEQGQVQAMAGVREALVPLAIPEMGLRLIQEPFMTINQAVGCAKDKSALAAHLATVVRDAKADGRIAGILRRHGVE